MTLFLVIFILLIALVIYAIVGTNDEREYYRANGVMPTITPTETETPSPSSSPTGTITPVYITSTPEPTPVPTPTPTPTPTPEPTLEPQTPGTELASDSITSSDEYMLRMRTDYVVTVVDEDTVQVEVNVTALHYSLYYNSYRALCISLDGDEQWMDVPAINCDDNSLNETLIGSYIYTVPAPRNTTTVMGLSVKWNFNGSYGNKEIPSITCDTQILVTR